MTGKSDGIKICVDSTDIIPESREENNCVQNVLEYPGIPDLIIIGLPEEGIARANRTYNTMPYRVRNVGDGVAGPSKVSIKINGIEKVTEFVGVLAQGENYTSAVGHFSTSRCNDVITICADRENVVSERNEENNCIERIPVETLEETPAPAEAPKIPGFGLVFALVGLLAIAYLLMLRRRGDKLCALKTLPRINQEMREKVKGKKTRKKLVKVALIVIVVVVVSAGIGYYSIPTESDILVLDKSVLTVVTGEIPETREGAISAAQDRIINATGVPKRSFNRYFRLMNASHTQFLWHLVYNVTSNPDFTVFLVKRISPEEGFSISDEHVVGRVRSDYFNAHFKHKSFDSNSNTAYYTYTYRYSHNPGDIELTMWVRLGNDRSVTGQHVVTTPQEITVSVEQAIDIGRKNGLDDPLSGSPVLVGGKICWRVVWQHTPTEQDYDNQTVYGVDVHCTTGEVIGKHRYKRPTPPPIQLAQVTSLIEKLGLEGIEDGAIIQVCVMNSSNEKFSVVKTFGRTIVKEGTIENTDISLWLDRELIANALESDDAVSYLQNHATSRNVIVELHKNMVLLQKKGYMSLYEKLNRKNR
ncbi:MAG: PGF-CTERM sorting domain-containing protein [Methanophagales archaeon]|nr:PGF-CTERM sorting domain-containing protein [Methanophagales archaeon]